MKKMTKAALVVAMLFSGAASANLMHLDLTNFGGNLHDAADNNVDANSATGQFEEFGFTGLWATSVYDFSDGSIFSSFYDTNIETELQFNGIPLAGTSGASLDGTSTVNLRHGVCNTSTAGTFTSGPVTGAGAECDIDALNPLAPPLFSDDEGFLTHWDMKIEYHFDGNLTATGAQYTGGYLNVYFNSFIDDSYDILALSANLTGSTSQVNNLDLFFDITFAVDGFLNIWNGGSFVDAAAVIANGGVPTIKLDTNVNPPIPLGNQLLLLVDDNGTTNAIRQTSLDGTATAMIPEPGSIALIGLGLFGIGMSARRNKKA